LTFPPWLALALAASLAMATLYQICSRRFGWRIMLYWMLIFFGFLAGEVVSESVNWDITRFGELRLLPDLMGAGLILAGLWFLGI
jgi:hypothetical protein